MLAAALCLGAPPASASTWTPVTGLLNTSLAEPDAVRSADGVLHVVWTRDDPGGTGTESMLQAPISPSGSIGSITTVASAFSAAGKPAIVTTSNGLEVFFGGIQCTTTGCPEGLFGSTSTDGGVTWSAPVSLTDTDQSYASDVAAVITPDGTPFETWSHTTGVTVHRGVTSTSPDYDFQAGLTSGCCGYNSNLAVDDAGDVDLAWDSNASGFEGVWAQQVDPSTGAPLTTAALMPGTVTDGNHVQMLSRTPIVALPGAAGRFYVAYPGNYPSTTKVLLWQVGASQSTTIVDEPGDHNEVSLAVDDQARLWTFWTHVPAGGDATHVYARRMSAAGSLEPVIDLGSPPNSSGIYALDGYVAPNGNPEVLAVTGLTDGSFETFYTQGPQEAPLPAPVLGKAVNVDPVSGTVLVKLPGRASAAAVSKGKGFVPLTAARQLPVGTQVDARRGTLSLVAATGKGGKTQSGVFGGGLFGVSQDTKGLTKGLTTLRLLEGAFHGAPSYARCPARGASDSLAHAAASPTVLQTLHARDNHGHFRTRTRSSAGTSRGTVWDTIDRCDGTLTIVHRGTVLVHDFGLGKTVTVRAGHTYLAKLHR